MHILMVCVGNINRSPAAEIIFNKLNKDPAKSCTSAAISEKNEGKGMTKKMRDSLEKAGITPVDIRSKPVTQEMVDTADLILYMDNANKKKLIEKFGLDVMLKSECLGTFGGFDKIPDPHFAKGTTEHEKVIGMIQKSIEAYLLETDPVYEGFI